MILYRPDGMPFETSLKGKPKHCFLITQLKSSLPREASEMRQAITKICHDYSYKVIDATAEVTGKDFLLKIWKFIATTPISIGICYHDFPYETIMNIYYELGAARAMGKETIIIKSKAIKYPSDLVRDEYIEFGKNFDPQFRKFLDHTKEQANYYETMADQLENDPLLSMDYLGRAYLIAGQNRLKEKIEDFRKKINLKHRAKNSVEKLIAKF